MTSRHVAAFLERLARAAGGFTAEWRDLVALHFAVPHETLAPHVPYPLDVRNGLAFTTLVAFESADTWPARLSVHGAPDRGSARQDVVLYACVRGPAGPGSHILAEWRHGAAGFFARNSAYGLPPRSALIDRAVLRAAGLGRIVLVDTETELAASFVFPCKPDSAGTRPAPGSMEAFLFERPVAYCGCEDSAHAFTLDHEPWEPAPFRLARTNTPLFDHLYPWFKDAFCVGGHLLTGAHRVEIGPPAPAHGEPAVALQTRLARSAT
ncbi:hypothetical protein ASA1KI_01780 [Opitutales bacterium ASA1]|uniref:DUF2071 domain-containing protein n=1 Tax=Congregicoccus parvus TaxID=3081749 RepID=UPI002B29A404|nr:hypothetical protein ASA1KI_01780 [Opitutales bacterium ASA1]